MRLKKIVFGGLGGFVTIALSFWSGAKLVMDAIGRASIVEDFANPDGFVAKAAQWLFTTPWWVPAILATLLVLGLIAYLMRVSKPAVLAPRSDSAPPTAERHPEPLTDVAPPRPVAVNFEPRGLYVGELVVDAQHVASEFYLEIAVLGFNATGSAISFGQVLGTPTFCSVVDGKHAEPINLPSPKIIHGRTPTENVGNLKEFMLVLEQRIPRDLVHTLSGVSGSSRAHIRLVGVDIMVAPTARPSQAVRLPIWSGLTLHREPERIIVGKIIELSANASFRPVASGPA